MASSTEKFMPLFTDNYLQACLGHEFRSYCESGEDQRMRQRLLDWANRTALKETSDSSGLINLFFVDIWGYRPNYEAQPGEPHSCWPEFGVSGAGQTGGAGSADLGLGWFDQREQDEQIAQVLCEFKDIRTAGLDQRQPRKGNDRSPVKQCFDYLRQAENRLFGHEPVKPTWGIVTDMNEFRLYHRGRGPAQSMRFFIKAPESGGTVSLVDESEEGTFQRFLFRTCFVADQLLAESGKSRLEQLLDNQWVQERTIEKEFYLEYRAYRMSVYEAIVAANPQFPGTRGKLVRLTQRFLDRCLFILFCEDMGDALAFPQGLLRNVLVKYSQDPYYDPNDDVLWQRVKQLFRCMDEGCPFAGQEINCFNGGLFREEPELESLRVPASVFCAEGQGAGGEAELKRHKNTLLYLSASYNFGVKGREGGHVIDLYTLGRIFEQSITELEIMEADADGRVSINKLTKRKTDGVYYTPEKITEYIVRETIGTRVEDIKRQIGFDSIPYPDDEDVRQYRRFLDDRRRTARVASKYLQALDRYRERLNEDRRSRVWFWGLPRAGTRVPRRGTAVDIGGRSPDHGEPRTVGHGRSGQELDRQQYLRRRYQS